MGAKNSCLLPDQKVTSHLKHRAKRSFEPVFPDPDARYARVVEYDASKIEPMIACPHAVDNVKPLSELVGKHIDQAFLGTCTNGGLEDLADAAAILRGRRIYNLVKFVLPFKGHFLVSV